MNTAIGDTSASESGPAHGGPVELAFIAVLAVAGAYLFVRAMRAMRRHKPHHAPRYTHRK